MKKVEIKFISKSKDGVILNTKAYVGSYLKTADAYVILYEDADNGKGKITIRQRINYLSFKDEINGCSSHYRFNIANVTKATMKDNLGRKQEICLKTDEMRVVEYIIHISYHLYMSGLENIAAYYEIITEVKE